MNSKGIQKVEVKKIMEGKWMDCDDLLVIEEPIEIRLQHGAMAKPGAGKYFGLPCGTPGNDKELALGFLFTEGIIQNFSNVKMVIEEASGPNTLLVILKEDIQPITPSYQEFLLLPPVAEFVVKQASRQLQLFSIFFR